MKVRKEIYTEAVEVEPGDVLVGRGVVRHVEYNSRTTRTEIVYRSDDTDYLWVANYEPYFQVVIVREVETPDSMTVSSRFGTILRFSSSPGDSVEVGITNRTDLVEGLVFSAQELIDAIKTVKGLD